MILDEPITRVFELHYKDKLLKDWHNAYIHTIGAFEYHVTEGYWLLLETENHYVTVGYDGVRTYSKPYDFPKDRYEWWYDGDEEWPDDKDILLSGQRLISVERREDCQVIHFDKCDLSLYIYGESDSFCVDRGTFGDGISIMAVGGHLLNKCSCGGNAEILIDERSDYAVRCSICHTSTYIDMKLNERIDAWNNGDRPCVIDTGREELMRLLADAGEIKYLALPSGDWDFKIYDSGLCECTNVVMTIDGSYFLLSSQKLRSDRFDFTGIELCSYNRESWANVILPTDKMTFVREEVTRDGKNALRFDLDGVSLLIVATSAGLAVSIDGDSIGARIVKYRDESPEVSL